MDRITTGLVGLSALAALAVAVGNQPQLQAQAPAATVPLRASGGKLFTLFVYEPPSSFEARVDPARSKGYWAAFAAFGETLGKEGVLRGGSAVHPIAEGRSVSLRSGVVEAARIRADPTGLELGGYFVVEAADLDSAVRWAGTCPVGPDGLVVVRENIAASPAMSATPDNGASAISKEKDS